MRFVSPRQSLTKLPGGGGRHLSVMLYLPNQKSNKLQKLYLLEDHVRVESFSCVVSFDPRHVTRLSPIGKRTFELGGMTVKET